MQYHGTYRINGANRINNVITIEEQMAIIREHRNMCSATCDDYLCTKTHPVCDSSNNCINTACIKRHLVCYKSLCDLCLRNNQTCQRKHFKFNNSVIKRAFFQSFKTLDLKLYQNSGEKRLIDQLNNNKNSTNAYLLDAVMQKRKFVLRETMIIISFENKYYCAKGDDLIKYCFEGLYKADQVNKFW
jgi:hypothetical protein